MEGGDMSPFRTSRSVHKPSARQSESPLRQPEPATRDPEPTTRPPESSQSVRHSSKQFKLPLVAGIVVIIFGTAGWFIWSQLHNKYAVLPVDGSKYQAVTTTGGQIYFGKLSLRSNEYIKLSDAYYLQTQTDALDSEKDKPVDQDKVKLIKLSNKAYSPKNTIVIPKAHVLSYESLDPNGKVAEWLAENSAQ